MLMTEKVHKNGTVDIQNKNQVEGFCQGEDDVKYIRRRYQVQGEDDSDGDEQSIQCYPHNKKFCGGPGGGFSKEPPGRRRHLYYLFEGSSKP